jgi:cell division protein YceG involved in septum cleavage
VIYPQATDYYFFRASCSQDGTHRFAKTLEEQAANACP